MKVKHFINLHKGLTFFVILGLMGIYNNFSVSAYVYLALHGTYGFIWLLKDRIYPDKQWETEIPLTTFVFGFFFLGLYWVAPYLLISSNIDTPAPAIALAIGINILGVFLHYSSDAQKHFTLKYRSGLIDEGFFARCRNTNYLGEFCIYSGFALLSYHWQPFLILGLSIIALWLPNMKKKDASLSRYPDFENYRRDSGLFFPKLWGNNSKKEVITE